MTRQALLVLGMHRSGTSALTDLLIRLGAQVPRSLLHADEHNPLGYWESVAVRDFHDRLLQAVGTSWDMWTRVSPHELDPAIAARLAGEFRSLLEQEYGDAPLFVVKDPRMCRFVPFWLKNLEEANIRPAAILVVRNPLEVARSLAARNRFSQEHSFLLWLRHMLDAEVETRSVTRSIVRYADLLNDWKAVAGRIAEDIGVQWRRGLGDAEIVHGLNPELRHHAIESAESDVDPLLSHWVDRTYQAFDLLLGRDTRKMGEAFAALDDIRGELDRATGVFGRAVEGDRQALRAQAADLEQARHHLLRRVTELEVGQHELTRQVSTLEEERHHMRGLARQLTEATHTLGGENLALRESRSWRWTAPLRVVFRIWLYVSARIGRVQRLLRRRS